VREPPQDVFRVILLCMQKLEYANVVDVQKIGNYNEVGVALGSEKDGLWITVRVCVCA